MTARAALTLCVALMSPLAAAQNPPAEGPPVPFEDVGACPSEACAYGEWIARQPVVALRERQRGSRVAFTVFKGGRVTALTGVVVTTRAGRAQFRVPHEMNSRSGRLRVEPGQTLYLLTYQGEGFTKAWFNGQLYDQLDASDVFNAACQNDPGRCAGRVVEPPQYEWWVQVRSAAGREGWTNRPEAFDKPRRG
jgi:hypothetical protein